ncbi:MAG: hypothetical protein IJ557_02315 [Bacteroidaceae bacterium]|nr:hypothetical protein [Bacteroidaceae bacterium]
MKYIQTNKHIFGITQNPDGTLAITREYTKIAGGIFDANSDKSEPNPGSVIFQLGGVMGTLERCMQDIDETNIAEYVEQMNKKKREQNEKSKVIEATRRENERVRAAKEYEEVFGWRKVVESNKYTIRILLHYLNTINWGVWPELPCMTIGYTCNQYDCDGTQATAIKLDRPIEYAGEMVSMFQTGAPHGHLMKYYRI